MLTTVTEVYSTYRNDKERHGLRLFAQCAISLLVGLLGVGVSQLPLTVMSLAISVLTGFSFSALFSEPSTRLTDLPAARDETDREDIATLKQLSLNFRVRTKLFIIMAVLELLLMVLLVIRIEIPIEIIERLFPAIFASDVLSIFSKSRVLLSHVVVTFIIFIFLEWIYTFYRLSETIMAVLRIRGDYMEAHRDRA